MPWLEEPTPLYTFTAQRDLAAQEPSVLGDFWEQPQPVDFRKGFKAGFQLENPVAEAIRADHYAVDNSPEEGFSYKTYAKDNGVSDLEEQLAWANNTKVADAIVRHAMQERDLRRERDASGWGGTIGGILGGFASPTTLLPGLGLVRAAKGGYAVGKSALGIAGAAGISTTIDEAILQGLQAERPASETAFAIGGSVLLGGLLGGVAASVLGRTERELFERGWKELNESTGSSAGAEAVKKWSYDDLSISGILARGIVNATDFINPNFRMATSASLVVREIGQLLGENTAYMKLHDVGLTAAKGGSAETYTSLLLRSGLNLGLTAVEDQYKAMKAAGISMKSDDFMSAVGRAMRRNDQGENEFISAAAAAMRKEATDKWKDAAIREKLLPPDVTVEEAASYFSRVWKSKDIIANEEAFKADVMPWMLEKMDKSFTEHRVKTLAKIEQLRADIEDMKLDKAGRLAALSDIDAKMSELATTYREGFEVDQEVKRLRKEAAKAKKAGDKANQAILLDTARQVASNAKEYRDAVAPYLRRRRVIERGTGATDAKIEKVQDQLVRLEEANLTSLRRLVNKGRWLERELGKTPSEEQLKEMIADLNETFNQVAKQYDDGFDRLVQTRAKLDAEMQKMPENGTEVPAKDPGIGKIRTRIDGVVRAQEARRAKLDKIAQKLDEAETIDIVEIKNTLNEMVEDLVADISSMTLGRGERAARLLERMEKLDPKIVAEQIAKREKLLEAHAKNFEDRWSIKMLGQDAELTGKGKADFSIAAKEAVQEIFDAITGKNNLMNSEMSEWRISPKRGPLKDRTFHIPDEMVERWLDSDVKRVHEIMGRRIAGQIALAKKFDGDTTLEGKLKEVKLDYDKLQARVSAAKSYEEALNSIGQHFGFKEKMKENFVGFEKTQQGLKLWLNKEMESDIADIKAMRDLILGRFRPELHGSNFGRSVRALNQINYTRLSGRFLISSLADMYRVPMMMGLGRSLGVLPKLMSDAVTSDGVKVTQAVIREAKLASLVSERMLHTRMASIAELGDPFAHGNQAERFIENMTRFSTKWNGMALFQDWLESWGSVAAMNNIIEALGKADPRKMTKDDRWLAMLGIDKLDLGRRVAKELQTHAEKVDGLWVANTEKWKDQDSVDAFRNALSKEVTRTIIRPSHGDVPTAWKTPLGAGLFQFRSFMVSAHQRIMLAGLQESGMRFLSGLVGMTTIGMAISYIKALGNGQESYERWKEQAKNPMFLLGEGLDNSAMFPLMFELSNSVEKITKGTGAHFNPIKSPMKALYDGKFETDSQKTWNVPVEQALLGPIAGMASAAKTAADALIDKAQGKELTKGQVRRGAAAIPFSTHLGFKEIIQLLNDDLPYMR